jgi:spore coat polysaccharide biosynthesis protein SpsF
VSDTVVVVQARMGSSRLPGKVAQEIGGLPALVLQLRRLAPIGLPLVVATSTDPRDDAVVALADAGGADVVRGDEQDVLGRFAAVLDRRPMHVVRMTGDCPLADQSIVAAVLDLHRASGAAYTTNVLPRSFPKGLDVEVMTAAALVEAIAEATDPAEREHVTPFLYRRPERFALANLLGDDDLGEERWTLDTADDLERLRQIAAGVADPVAATYGELLAVAGRTTAPGPGDVHLRPVPGSEPGDCPWRRAWVVEIDGEAVGSAEVAVGNGDVERRIDVAPALAADARAALDRLLAGDAQIRG